jgi:hypothetical protein
MAEREVASFPLSRLLAKSRGRNLLNGTALLFVFALLGCDRSSMMKKMIPEQDAAVAKRYVEAIRHGEYETVEQNAAPSIAGPDLRSNLTSLRAVFPGSSTDPTSIKPVALRFFGNKHEAINTSITLEYEFPGEWVLAEVTTQKVGDAVTITGVHARSMPESIESVNGFTFADKGGSQYIVLILAIAAPLLALYAFVMCIKTRLGWSKWLWLVSILVGVGKLTVNWTTGQLFVTPFAIQLVPGGANAMGYAPWMVYTSLPVGAIAFLFYRNSRRAPAQAIPGGPESETDESTSTDSITTPDKGV